MTNCCDDILFVGCFGSCESIPLLIDSDYTGSATLIFDWLGKSYSYGVVVEDGEQIVLPNIFNEQSSVVFKIKKNDGTFFRMPIGESESGVNTPGTECFYLQNQMQINISNIAFAGMPTPGNIILTSTSFDMLAGEDTVNIGSLATLPFQLYINGNLQNTPGHYTISGSVITIVSPPDDFDYQITIVTYSYS